MKFRSLGVAAVALLLPFAAVACSSDDDDSSSRPSADEISTKLQEAFNVSDDNSEAVAGIDCAAEGLHDSDLSDELLQTVMDGGQDAVEGADKAEFDKALADIQATCAADTAE